MTANLTGTGADPARRTKFYVQTQLTTELVEPGCKAGYCGSEQQSEGLPKQKGI